MKQRRSLGCLKKKKKKWQKTSFLTFDLRNLSPLPLSCCSTEAAQYSSAHSPTNPPQDRR